MKSQDKYPVTTQSIIKRYHVAFSIKYTYTNSMTQLLVICISVDKLHHVFIILCSYDVISAMFVILNCLRCTCFKIKRFR